MEELKKKISDLISDYFEEKLQYVDWRDDTAAKKEADDTVKEAIRETLFYIRMCDEDLDEQLEKLEFEHSDEPDPYWEAYDLDAYYRTRDLLN